jgi:hypothetical protein
MNAPVRARAALADWYAKSGLNPTNNPGVSAMDLRAALIFAQIGEAACERNSQISAGAPANPNVPPIPYSDDVMRCLRENGHSELAKTGNRPPF